MVVAAGLDLDLGLDPREERRRRMEDEPVGARLDVGELADPPVVVGLAVRRRARRRGRAGRGRRRPARRSPVSRTWVEITACIFSLAAVAQAP